MIPLKNPEIFPRPLEPGRRPWSGYCCLFLEEAARLSMVEFGSLGAYGIVVPAHPGANLAIAFCPFCGFKFHPVHGNNRVFAQQAAQRPILLAGQESLSPRPQPETP